MNNQPNIITSDYGFDDLCQILRENVDRIEECMTVRFYDVDFRTDALFENWSNERASCEVFRNISKRGCVSIGEGFELAESDYTVNAVRCNVDAGYYDIDVNFSDAWVFANMRAAQVVAGRMEDNGCDYVTELRKQIADRF